MQAVSALWKTISATYHQTEYKVTVGDTEYDKSSIVGLSLSSGLFSGRTLAVGCCVSAQIDLTLQDVQSVPRNAEVKVYVRLTDGTQASEWLPYGVYYIDTRESVPDSGTLTLHCYDAMLKAEQTFVTEGDTGTWPRTMTAVVTSICTRMGVELDSRTALNSAYTVEYPNDYTMRVQIDVTTAVIVRGHLVRRREMLRGGRQHGPYAGGGLPVGDAADGK